MIQGVAGMWFIFFNRQIARVRLRESNSALLNLAIYAVFVFTPTAIMAQLNNLAVVCKWRWPNINCKFKVLQIIQACSLCFTLPAWCEYAQFVLVRFWASFFLGHSCSLNFLSVLLCPTTNLLSVRPKWLHLPVSIFSISCSQSSFCPACCSPSWLLASAQVGSLPWRVMMACNHFLLQFGGSSHGTWTVLFSFHFGREMEIRLMCKDSQYFLVQVRKIRVCGSSSFVIMISSATYQIGQTWYQKVLCSQTVLIIYFIKIWKLTVEKLNK